MENRSHLNNYHNAYIGSILECHNDNNQVTLDEKRINNIFVNSYVANEFARVRRYTEAPSVLLSNSPKQRAEKIASPKNINTLYKQNDVTKNNFISLNEQDQGYQPQTAFYNWNRKDYIAGSYLEQNGSDNFYDGLNDISFFDHCGNRYNIAAEKTSLPNIAYDYDTRDIQTNNVLQKDLKTRNSIDAATFEVQPKVKKKVGRPKGSTKKNKSVETEALKFEVCGEDDLGITNSIMSTLRPKKQSSMENAERKKITTRKKRGRCGKNNTILKDQMTRSARKARKQKKSTTGCEIEKIRANNAAEKDVKNADLVVYNGCLGLDPHKSSYDTYLDNKRFMRETNEQKNMHNDKIGCTASGPDTFCKTKHKSHFFPHGYSHMNNKAFFEDTDNNPKHFTTDKIPYVSSVGIQTSAYKTNKELHEADNREVFVNDNFPQNTNDVYDAENQTNEVMQNNQYINLTDDATARQEPDGFFDKKQQKNTKGKKAFSKNDFTTKNEVPHDDRSMFYKTSKNMKCKSTSKCNLQRSIENNDGNVKCENDRQTAVLEEDNSNNEVFDLALFYKRVISNKKLHSHLVFNEHSTCLDFIKLLSAFNLFYKINMPKYEDLIPLKDLLVFCIKNGGFFDVVNSKIPKDLCKTANLHNYLLLIYPFEQHLLNRRYLEIYSLRDKKPTTPPNSCKSSFKIMMMQRYLNESDYESVNHFLLENSNTIIDQRFYDFMFTAVFSAIDKLYETRNPTNYDHLANVTIFESNQKSEIAKSRADDQKKKRLLKTDTKSLRRAQKDDLNQFIQHCLSNIVNFIEIHTNYMPVNDLYSKPSNGKINLISYLTNYIRVENLDKLMSTIFTHKNQFQRSLKESAIDNIFSILQMLVFLYDFNHQLYKNTKNLINIDTIPRYFTYFIKAKMSKNIKRKIIRKTENFFNESLFKIQLFAENEDLKFDFAIYEQTIAFLSDLKSYRDKFIYITKMFLQNFCSNPSKRLFTILNFMFLVLNKYFAQYDLLNLKMHLIKYNITTFDHFFDNPNVKIHHNN